MKHKMFAIHDAKAHAYLPPWFLPTLAMATRTFGDCCNDKNHAFAAHPEDYTLFLNGEFDDATGIVTPQKNHSLGNGIEFVIQQQNKDQTDAFEELKYVKDEAELNFLKGKTQQKHTPITDGEDT